MTILWWLAPAVLATIVAIWITRGLARRDLPARPRTDLDNELFGAALNRKLTVDQVAPVRYPESAVTSVREQDE